jgi:hypothetical protein
MLAGWPQMLHLQQRRHVRTRRSGVSELLHHTVTDALFDAQVSSAE